LLDLRADGVVVDPMPLPGCYPSMATVRIDAAPVVVVVSGGNALLALHRALSVERMFLAVMLVEATDLLLEEAANRTGGRADAWAVAAPQISRFAARLAAARALLSQLTEAYEAGRTPAVPAAAAARYLAAELAADVARYLVEVSGTRGLLPDEGCRPLDRLEIVIAHGFAGGSQRALLTLIGQSR
jgi:alkylation response protein AidB-like acyl-CoA dehydrogenase